LRESARFVNSNNSLRELRNVIAVELQAEAAVELLDDLFECDLMALRNEGAALRKVILAAVPSRWLAIVRVSLSRTAMPEKD
jgi:hypothetical protein